ncbi:MAG: polysaccharide export protein EpsE [Pseudomonadota bacterium]|nr:polysaccharide export protein EpsE [Pseudomonadota bacterium]
MNPVRFLAAAGFAALLGLTSAAHAQAQPAGASVNTAEYRLGAGDGLRILVFQNPDLTLETRITDRGMVSYPLLGNVRLGGLSIGSAEKLIADGLRSGGFVKQPQVTISLLQVRSSQASVLGQVNRPGRYPIEVADMRLSDMLATAGGTAPGGSDIVVLSGTRNGQPYRTEVDLPLLFSANGRQKDVVIEDGDTIWIDRQPIVYIYGEVQRPGPIRLERDLTLMQALATGGGLTGRGTEKGIRVHRKMQDGSTKVYEMPLTAKLQEGDVVFVKESLF